VAQNRDLIDPGHRKERMPLIDAAKGFAILLVVLGHSVQTYVLDFDHNLLFRFIYSFHMPLFMFLSGYITIKTDFFSLRIKFNRLMIPFVVWYLLSYVLTHAYQTIPFTEYIVRWIKSPDYGLWFLMVLFWCHCALAICMRLRKYAGNFSFLLVYLAICMIPTGEFGIGLVKLHFIPFISGYLIAKNRVTLQKLEKPAMLLSVFLFASLFGYWNRTQEPSFIPVLKAMFSLRGINYIVHFYRYLIAFAGIGLSFFLIMRLTKVDIAYTAFRWLGRYTLEIYVLHTYLLGWNLGTGYLQIFSAAVIALFSSIIIATILKQSSWLNRLLFGQKPASAQASIG